MSITYKDHPILYVADYGNNRIEVFNADTGKYIKSIGNSNQNEEDNLHLPYDVVIEVPTSNDMYGIDYPILYVSDSKSRVQVYNGDSGQLLRTIGYGHGFEHGELNCPLGYYICTLLYFICYDNHCKLTNP